jgi:TPR repeat protein
MNRKIGVATTASRHDFAKRLAFVAIIFFATQTHLTAQARADAAAGSTAFEKGDYVRAMAEWASAAEHGDADAEFGLGMLHERGAGELKQDYKQANQWYQKAAEHGNIGAEYRLALIWAAGGDDFPPDFVEAYKWILLASEKGLATDAKAMLEGVIDRSQQAEAHRRVTGWKEAQTAKRAQAAATVVPAPPPAAGAVQSVPPPRDPSASPATAAKSGGCPGWPFPTLPCTEQFPALGAAPMQASPAPPSNRLPAPR